MKSLGILETLPEYQLEMATTVNNLALIYTSTEKYKKAETLYISAIKKSVVLFFDYCITLFCR